MTDEKHIISERTSLKKDTPVLTEQQNSILHALLSQAKTRLTPVLVEIYPDHPPSAWESVQLEAALISGPRDPDYYFKPMDLFRFEWDGSTDVALNKLGFQRYPVEGLLGDPPHRLKIDAVDLSTPSDQPNFPYMLTVGSFRENGHKEIKLLVEPRAVVLKREADDQAWREKREKLIQQGLA